MGRLSEHQKEALKFRIIAGLVVFLVGGTIFLVGPGLPRVLEHTRKNADKPWAARRYYQIAQLMEITYRKRQAVDIYVEMYHLYHDEDEADFDLVEGERYFTGDAYYMPWVIDELEDEEEEHVAVRSDPYWLGKALLAYAEYQVDKKVYWRSRHIWACLFTMWPEDSEIHAAAAKARLRDASRSM